MNKEIMFHWHFPSVPFSEIDCKKNKINISESIINKVLLKNLTFVIVKTKPSFFDKAKYNNIAIYKNSFSIYAIDSKEHINECINVLIDINLWHKPIFHILICKADFIGKMLSYFKNKKNIKVYEFENNFISEIIGILDPVDDLIEIYGNQEIEDIFKGGQSESAGQNRHEIEGEAL